MKPEAIINAIKEFFLEILGFLIPGMFFFFVLQISLLKSTRPNPKDYDIPVEMHPYIFLIGSYLMGYVLYSFSYITDKLTIGKKWLKLKTDHQIQNDITSTFEYELSLEQYKNQLATNSYSTDTSKIDFNTFRSIAMSYSPESDSKIYTFKFRAELCRLVGAASLFLGYIFLALGVFNKLKGAELLIRSNYRHLFLYFILIVFAYFLFKTRNRFNNISDKIPFSIYLSKTNKLQ